MIAISRVDLRSNVVIFRGRSSVKDEARVRGGRVEEDAQRWAEVRQKYATSEKNSPELVGKKRNRDMMLA